MKKQTFISILVGTIGGLLFSLGMCMCLLPEWNAFKYGVVCAAIGGALLLVLGIASFIKSGKKIHFNWKTIGKVLFGIIGALVLGVGMAMIMALEGMMIQGIIVGVVGIVMLLFLIPMCVGLKDSKKDNQ